MLKKLMGKKDKPVRKSCERCGDCCRKGGPTLHLEDKTLFDEGALDVEHLSTFRAGELVRNQITGVLEPLEREIIKVKGQPGGWTCIFLDEDGASCAIYDKRPAECRALECWDTSALEGMYDKSRLERGHLLGEGSKLREVVEEHERLCGLLALAAHAQVLAQGPDEDAERGVLSILRYDESLRSAFMYRAQAGYECLDFLFGRPLASTLYQFGLEVVEEQGRQPRVACLPPERDPRKSA